MKYFEYEYTDGLYSFIGTAKFYNGFNPVQVMNKKSFRDNFHKKYPKVNFNNLVLNISGFKILSVKEIENEKR